MAKRGRKRTRKRYFDTEQEEAIVEYLNTDCPEERNQIYEDRLKQPLYKMAESIINRYQLYSYKLSFDELLHDTLSDLHTKIEKFDPSKGTKAYSYFGTIIKNYALGKRIKEQKEMKRVYSYEKQAEYFCDDERYSYQINDEDSVMKEFFYQYIDIIQEVLDKNEEEDFLKPNEEKIGLAVVHLMKNWEDVFEDGSNKYNKAQVLECLRNMTNLTTKDIRDNLKRFKTLYYQKKKLKIKRAHKLNVKSKGSSDIENSKNIPNKPQSRDNSKKDL